MPHHHRAACRGAAIAFATLFAVVAPARAEPDGGVNRVIELFTSQGCPRCPPADRLITALARDPHTIALSYAVSIWDYAGWRDTLASSISNKRQAAYAAARGDRLIFTPQAIVDGVAVEPGADAAAIVRDAKAFDVGVGPLTVPLDVSESDGMLHIKLGAQPTRGPIGLYVLRVARAKTVQIDRGPNSGRNVTYTNVVRAMRHLGDWTGAPEQFDILELKADDEGYVVLLQTGTPDKPGAILAAAKTAGL